ncbi:MAG TPA: sigma 54-interacting transcriptional regulator [Planctomycetota bacterium]|jgi:DNA-binding NtrC family response regulator/predicted hydrocarbon binding protein
MKAEDLKLEEVVAFGDGFIDLHGRRLVLHGLHAFAQFRKDLIETVGADHARCILTRFGYFWGNADAAAMTRIFKWDSLSERLRAGPRMHALQGAAKTYVKTLDLDEARGRLHMEVAWHESHAAEEHLISFPRSDAPVCWMLVGYASGYASFCMGKDVYFLEGKCRAKGDRICTAVGKDVESWGEEIKPHLSYYQACDIQKNILALTRELKQKTTELARQRTRLDSLTHATKTSTIEARSESFRRVLELANRVAPYDSSLLITGESGVGKEVLARHIHNLSPRASGIMQAVNCTALPETLLESELFGHKAGAFTGAMHDRIGIFEQAQKGTLFLDEIGEISHPMQVKLLRVLQAREIMRVGESRPRKIDVRIIAATNRNLEQAVRDGKFREDLYYRLRVIEVYIPPLRERKEDILPLARFFVQQFARRLKRPNLRLDAAALDFLQAYPWPGNVRELENAIERAAVLSRDAVIMPECLPPSVIHGAADVRVTSGMPERTLAQVEQDYIRSVLQVTGGNRARAARILGISAVTLWRRLKGAPDPLQRRMSTLRP